MDLERVFDAVFDAGMICRGGFHPLPTDGVPVAAATLVLVGNAGPALWEAFAGDVCRSSEEQSADLLDEWTRRTLTAIALRFGAMPLFPFDGPPFLPFLAWARRAEPVFPSPWGPLIHREYGLWHAYRGALGFATELPLPTIGAAGENPCDRCLDKPCLTTCPVGALSPGAYDVPACLAHLDGAGGNDCMQLGCRARRACPIGRSYLYPPAQASFHMRGFVASQRRRNRQRLDDRR